MVASRRQFLKYGGSAFLAASFTSSHAGRTGHAAGAEDQLSVALELPRGRVPLSFIIDDSTCLVNMGKFCMPQFAATYPQRKEYQQPWRSWPDEIPDAFVREFGQWCADNGVKGKYSIVPYPACVGWLDRLLPGWSQNELESSLQLVRDLILPNWDIHPEMISHTRVIDLKTGRPFADYSPAHMENSYPQEDIDTDHLAEYIAYALRILNNCGLPCEGITTPGGFGNRVKQKLPVAVYQAVRDVFRAEIPHYFKYVVEGEQSTEPTVELIEPLDRSRRSTDSLPPFTINIPAGTGDWFGGWDGSKESQPERYCSRDATSGRMVELIERRQPALMLCHWPGMYCNGTKTGFHAFQQVVQAIHGRFADEVRWMKLSEIARYWAARFWTEIKSTESRVQFTAPVACPDFTIRVNGVFRRATYRRADRSVDLRRVTTRSALSPDTWFGNEQEAWVCVDLPQGVSELILD